MNAENMLREYHERIGAIFLAPNQTPFGISKQVYALHAEMERSLAIIDYKQQAISAATVLTPTAEKPLHETVEITPALTRRLEI